MRCPRCGLPDLYRGQGDGIGSCDCPRCDCCGTGPDECCCRRDWEDIEGEEPVPLDWLCNDTGCVWRIARIERRARPIEKGRTS